MSTCRRRHRAAIAGLFAQVLGLCVQAGLVDAGLIAIDGTKVEANASFFANHTRERLAEMVLDDAEEIDSAEDVQFGSGGGDRMPEGWRGSTGRRARIRQALDQLESRASTDYEARMRQRAAEEEATGQKLRGPRPQQEPSRRQYAQKANTTDPESRIIATGARGVMQGFNAQAAATAQQIVVAADVSATTNDQPQFLPMADAVQGQLAAAGVEQDIGTIVADAGYWTADNGTAEVGVNALIATRKGNWRRAPRPSDDKLAVLQRVNSGAVPARRCGDPGCVLHLGAEHDQAVLRRQR